MAADTRPLEEIFDTRFDRKMNIAQRLHLAMTLADYLQKEKKEGMKYTIVSHDKVTGMVRDITIKCGIVYYPVADSFVFSVDGNRAQLVLAVRFENIDDRNDFLDVGGIGFGIDPGDKGPGKAISYAVKYALLKALGLETGDDPDLDQDVQHRSSTQARADEFLKSLSVVTADGWDALVNSPQTVAIGNALQRDNAAEFRRVQQLIAARAKVLGIGKPAE